MGGGHAHVAVLKSFGMRPMPGIRLTLITPGAFTPYSGMLPGLLAGHYSFEESHIDLLPLCRFAGARFFRDRAIGIDIVDKKITCFRHPPVSYDKVSIDIGTTPKVSHVPGAREYALPVKPIEDLLEEIDRLVMAIARSPADGAPIRIVVVGGGAGGVEVILALRHRLCSVPERAIVQTCRMELNLVTESETILPTHNRRVQRKFARILRSRGVGLHLRWRVVRVEPRELFCDSGERLAFDALIWSTDASSPPWLRESGLPTDAKGFLLVNDCLQSVTAPDVFACGDIASVIDHPRPKSGVFAVRHGLSLRENLRRALSGDRLRPHHSQKRFLSLVSTGDRYAVASRGAWAVEGGWVWKLKNWIDCKWMRQYREFPVMKPVSDGDTAGGSHSPVLERSDLANFQMRCAGCGGKIGNSQLVRVLERLPMRESADVEIGLDVPDDAAVVRPPKGMLQVQSVDFLRAFISDPFTFGRIAAVHCLSDIFAMGAHARTAQAMAVVPFALESVMEEELFQLMSGVVSSLNDHHVALIGGHSSEGVNLAIGLVINGISTPDELIRKGGLKSGDALVLTKPLGVGTLLAAEMRGEARGDWIEGAVDSMLLSNGTAAGCLGDTEISAMTDITGFGLLGHLSEMLRAGAVGARLDLASVPLLEGAVATAQAGWLSSLHPQNLRFEELVTHSSATMRDPRYPILFDPQTSGGLLAGVPADRVDACLQTLRECGCRHVRTIGEVIPRDREAPTIEVVV